MRRDWGFCDLSLTYPWRVLVSYLRARGNKRMSEAWPALNESDHG
jgi:hypothetical protein